LLLFFKKEALFFSFQSGKRFALMRVSPSRVGFLLICFLMPGLIGTFASFSIPAPTVDEMHQRAALQAVLAAPTPAAQQAAIKLLPDKVDADTAALVANGAGPMPARVAAAEANMQAEVLAQARAASYRIRLLVITITLVCALLGVALLAGGRA
jgi:hypothetical protein